MYGWMPPGGQDMGGYPQQAVMQAPNVFPSCYLCLKLITDARDVPVRDEDAMISVVLRMATFPGARLAACPPGHARLCRPCYDHLKRLKEDSIVSKQLLERVRLMVWPFWAGNSIGARRPASPPLCPGMSNAAGIDPNVRRRLVRNLSSETVARVEAAIVQYIQLNAELHRDLESRTEASELPSEERLQQLSPELRSVLLKPQAATTRPHQHRKQKQQRASAAALQQYAQQTQQHLMPGALPPNTAGTVNTHSPQLQAIDTAERVEAIQQDIRRAVTINPQPTMIAPIQAHGNAGYLDSHLYSTAPHRWPAAAYYQQQPQQDIYENDEDLTQRRIRDSRASIQSAVSDDDFYNSHQPPYQAQTSSNVPPPVAQPQQVFYQRPPPQRPPPSTDDTSTAATLLGNLATAQYQTQYMTQQQQSKNQQPQAQAQQQQVQAQVQAQAQAQVQAQVQAQAQAQVQAQAQAQAQAQVQAQAQQPPQYYPRPPVVVQFQPGAQMPPGSGFLYTSAPPHTFAGQYIHPQNSHAQLTTPHPQHSTGGQNADKESPTVVVKNEEDEQ